jgi:hypothetical protein
MSIPMPGTPVLEKPVIKAAPQISAMPPAFTLYPIRTVAGIVPQGPGEG